MHVIFIIAVIAAVWLFAAFILAMIWRLAWQASVRARYQAAIDEHPAAVADALITAVDRDRIETLIEATREPYAAGRERIATPADQPDNPGLFLPAELDDLEQWRAELAEGSGL